MTIDNMKKLAHDSQRMKAIIQLQKLRPKQLTDLCTNRFDDELELSILSDTAIKNVELLRHRLDDAILLAADNQSGGLATKGDIRNAIQDIAKALGVSDG